MNSELASGNPGSMTITEAAKLTGKSPDAIRRAIKRKANPLLAPLVAGSYQITREALLEAGFSIRTHEQTPGAAPAGDSELEAMRAERDRAIAEAERAAVTLETMRQAIQALTITNETLRLEMANRHPAPLADTAKPLRTARRVFRWRREPQRPL